MTTFKFAYSGARANRLLLIQALYIFLLYCLFYGPVIPGLIADWQENSTFSYGALIPFVACYLVWNQRWEIWSAAIEPAFQAVIPLAIALMLGLIGKAIGESFTERISMIFALGASVYLLFGSAVLRLLLFPLGYLALMIPLPYVLTKEIAYHLRFLNATLAADILRLLDIPVYREAYFLHFPNITLEVADACAGLASIFSLFALAALYVYLLPVTWRAKIVLLGSAFPIAVFANLVRIVVLSVLSHYTGPAALDLPLHRFSGTSTFLLALLLLVGLGEYFHKNWPARDAGDHSCAISSREGDSREIVNWKAFGWGVAMFGCALWFSFVLNGSRSLAPPGSAFAHLPGSFIISGFTAAQVEWEQAYQDPKATESVSGIYLDRDAVPIEVFVGYKRFQSSGERLRSPKLSLGEDWNFAWAERARLPVGHSTVLDANWMLARNGKKARLILYWYQFGRNTESGELSYRISMAKRLLFQGRSDAAVVRLATPVLSDEPIENSQKRLNELAAQLYPELVRLLPQ